MNILQQLVLPNLSFGAPEEMYVRANDKVRSDLINQNIIFDKGSKVSFDTFFNSFTIGTWRENCVIDDLFLVLRGKGHFVIRFGIHRIGHAHRWLDEQTIELQVDSNCQIQINSWNQLESGMLFFTLESLSEGVLNEGSFCTKTKAINNIKLGLVITHFNRKKLVLPAIARIKNELLNDPLYQNNIELIVVDNSNNITTDEASGITLIPNKNLGGSGGFMRGLLHLKDEGDFTHCLFMDDDASCSIESIRRTFSLLQFSKKPQFAVAGSLLRELEPYRLFEKGAQFDGFCKPLKCGLDMRLVSDLLQAEVTDKSCDYGGWWFFAFSIDDVKKYAFPFFVRGDDIHFSLLNSFNICTLNGINCWGDDFSLKSSPLTLYLDFRSLLISKICVLNSDFISTFKMAIKFFMTSLLSYNYASSKAISLSLKHVIQGPIFWTENIDTIAIRAEIANFSNSEKMASINKSDYKIHYPNLHETNLRRFVRMMTLNGFLLPSVFLKKTVVHQHKGFRATLRQVFPYKYILYEYEPLSIGYVVQHNKSKFISEIFNFSWQIIKLLFIYKKLRNKYRQALPKMTSEKFWRDIYNNS